MARSRRSVLRSAGALAATAALAGCLDAVHRYRETYPVTLLVGNATDTDRRLAITVTVDGETAFAETVTVAARHYHEAPIAERAGTYRATATSDGLAAEVEWTVSWRDLADCNGTFLEGTIREDALDLAATRTDAACGHPLDRL